MAMLQLAYQRDPATGQLLFDSTGYPIPESSANTGANTYLDMQTRIQDEVLGSPTLAQIKNAIQDAILTFESQQFWFTDTRYYGDVTGSQSDLVTAAAKEFYSWQDLPVLIQMPFIRKILTFVNNNRWPLTNRTNQWIDDQSISPSWQSWPTDWAWVAGSLRLYPIPQGIYPLILDATIRFAPLVADDDYNCWTNEAEALIRFEAKRLLFANITRNPLQEAAMMKEIYGDPGIGKQGALNRLRRESTSRGGGANKIRASRGYM